jgi:hypothetical protein
VNISVLNTLLFLHWTSWIIIRSGNIIQFPATWQTLSISQKKLRMCIYNSVARFLYFTVGANSRSDSQKIHRPLHKNKFFFLPCLHRSPNVPYPIPLESRSHFHIQQLNGRYFNIILSPTPRISRFLPHWLSELNCMFLNLFNQVVRNSGCMLLGDYIIMNNELGRMWKEVGIDWFKVY